ncbi:unnamed protein product [Allacma fusca]|uniref:C2H2-type domain-containing protein n=1 Tax=Allacma fusca TaxID=39272 RepID=A0A8J2KL78_9HEXA|nr:unnamed protein product [Allacma fusca]
MSCLLCTNQDLQKDIIPHDDILISSELSSALKEILGLKNEFVGEQLQHCNFCPQCIQQLQMCQELLKQLHALELEINNVRKELTAGLKLGIIQKENNLNLNSSFSNFHERQILTCNVRQHLVQELQLCEDYPEVIEDDPEEIVCSGGDLHCMIPSRSSVVADEILEYPAVIWISTEELINDINDSSPTIEYANPSQSLENNGTMGISKGPPSNPGGEPVSLKNLRIQLKRLSPKVIASWTKSEESELATQTENPKIPEEMFADDYYSDPGVVDKDFVSERSLFDASRDVNINTTIKVQRKRPWCSKSQGIRAGELPSSRFGCNQCPKRFREQFYLDVHMKKYHEGLRTPYSCLSCQETFKTRSMLREHRKFKHNQDVLIRSDTDDLKFTVEKASPTSESCVCPVCGKVFQSNHLLQTHSRYHGEKKYKCTDCEKAFTKSHDLKKHRLTHLNERPFICEKCGKGYKESSTLHKHEKLCGKSVTDLHLCTDCGRSYKYSSSLLYHQWIHHKGPEYLPFSCETCHQRFRSKSVLERHIHCHLPPNQITCSICSAVFPTRNQLNRHVKLLHKDSPHYPCPHCPYLALHPGKLNIHLTVHTGDKPHVCDICDKRFARKSNMAKHKSRHAKNLQDDIGQRDDPGQDLEESEKDLQNNLQPVDDDTELKRPWEESVNVNENIDIIAYEVPVDMIPDVQFEISL